MENSDALDYILQQLQKGSVDLKALKNEAARRFQLKYTPRNSEILAYAKHRGMGEALRLRLKKRPMRTRSGVTPIAVMIRPQDSCNWGCIYCPFTGKAAKSYTGEEPAALRARDNAFDPYRQAQARIRQFESCGHPTDKCEVIVMGGTFLAMEPGYKTHFIKSIYDALNGQESQTLAEAQSVNETARHRVIGLTIETRPDVCIPHIGEILGYGATRVELGVQHPDDGIYAATNRGHTTQAVVDSTRELKNAAFKVLYHIMPGLPGSDPQKDVNMVRRLFDDERFRPDMLKIYPTLVIPGTRLYELQQRGEYRPYGSEEAAEVISEFYRYIPGYVRVMRIQRDIPATRIHDGVKKSNLRELVEEAVRRKKIGMNEIRYREIGWSREPHGNVGLKRLDYGASGGMEVFLSFESDRCRTACPNAHDPTRPDPQNFDRGEFPLSGLSSARQSDGLAEIHGFIRLRISGEDVPVIPQGGGKRDDKCALVRELHVYGQEAPLEQRGDVQHRGLGSQLLEEAERIAREEFGKMRMGIISGVGVREYYYKRGYRRHGPYVAKELR